MVPVQSGARIKESVPCDIVGARENGAPQEKSELELTNRCLEK